MTQRRIRSTPLVTRQRLWQMQNFADGLCETCAAPRENKKRHHCNECLEKRTAITKAIAEKKRREREMKVEGWTREEEAAVRGKIR